MIRLGAVGLGPRWESEFHPAVERLEDHVAMGAVFDHRERRTNQEARRLNVAPTGGVVALVDRNDIDGLLLIDADWHSDTLLAVLASRGKPIFLGAPHRFPLDTLDHLHSLAVLTGMTWLPELPARYAPATNRLQELLATRFGRIRAIDVELSGDSVQPADDGVGRTACHSRLMIAADWCSYLLKAPVERLTSLPAPNDDELLLHLHFGMPAGNDPVDVRFRFQTSANAEPPAGGDWFPGPVTVTSTDGAVLIAGPRELEWRHDSTSQREALETDPSAADVMIDHFCRRIAGGLLPVPSLLDVHRARLVSDAAIRCVRTGKPQACNAGR